MASTTIATLWGYGTTAIQNYLTTLFPILLPVAVGLAMLFAVWFWVRGSSHRRF